MERMGPDTVSMAKGLLSKLLDKWAACLSFDKQNGGRRLGSTWPADILSIRPNLDELVRAPSLATSRRCGLSLIGRALLLNAKKA
jgi:hypothetical protein